MIVFLLAVLIGLVLLGWIAEKWLLPVWCWPLLLGLTMILSLLLGGVNPWWAGFLSLPFLLTALIVGANSWRLRLITVPWLERIEVSLSQLEGKTLYSPLSWRRELIMGRLPEVERTMTLNQDEESFLAQETVQLCRKWQQALTKDPRGEISPQLLDFIATQGFNKLRLSKSGGGRSFSRAAVASVLTRLASCDTRLAQLIARLNGGLTLERYGSGSQQRKYLPLMSDKQFFVYRLSEQEMDGAYGVVCEDVYRNKEQLGIRLHLEEALFNLPDFTSLAEVVIPFYDPDNLLEDNGQTHICLLLATEWLKKHKKGFVPLNQALAIRNKAVIPFIRNETAVYSLVSSYAGLLNLAHKASAGVAALRCLGEEVDLAALAGLEYELASLAELRELSLQLAHQGEAVTEQDLQGNVNRIVSRAAMFGIRLSASQPQLSKSLLTISPARRRPITLGSVVQLHNDWREIANSLGDEQGKLDRLLMRLGARCWRSLFRCFFYGFSSLFYRNSLYRKQVHLALAFGLTMDATLINSIVFTAPFVRCDKAWEAIYTVMAVNRSEKQDWKNTIATAQEEVINLLTGLHPAARFLLCWAMFPLGKNYTRRTSTEDAQLAERLMVPSREREEMFRDINKQAGAHQEAEELLKLAWLVKDIYTGLREKNFHRPWRMTELDWYQDLHDQRHINANDMKIMRDFYLKARAFLA